MNITQLSARELKKGYLDRSIKVEDAIQSLLDHIKSNEAAINGFLDIYEEQSLLEARDWDQKYDNGDADIPELAGVPIALKDNLNDQGKQMRCASKILEGYESVYDATAVKKCKEAGLIIIGKTNMDEFAMGSSTEHSAYGPTYNPWDTNRVPGGSSGGSAAVVAAGFSPISLGSDTGGSIRQPASFCGVIGLKPTYGRVSRFGLVAFASSLDQIGPFTRSTEDMAWILKVISGEDSRDATSESVPVPDFLENLTGDVAGKKIGIPQSVLEYMDEGVKEQFFQTMDILKSKGASYEMMSWGDFDDALSAYYIIAPAEASANLERYDGVRYGARDQDSQFLHRMIKATRDKGFGPEVQRRILIGAYVLSSGYYDAYYMTAQKVRTLVAEQFEKSFESYDMIAMPTAPTTAFKVNQNMEDPMSMYYSDIATIPVNLAGVPGISVPSGYSDGMPVGVQFIAPHFEEGRLLDVSYCIQKEKPEWFAAASLGSSEASFSRVSEGRS